MEKTPVIEVDKGPLIFGATYSGIDPFGPIDETDHPSTYQLVEPVKIMAQKQGKNKIWDVIVEKKPEERSL